MTVDIILVTYNDGRYLKRCIDSVLTQRYRDFMFIIVDDGSTDDTPRIIANYTDRRIECHRFDINSGNIAAIRNRAVSFLRNDWCFFIDGDCHADEDWLARGVALIEAHQDIAGIEGQVIYGYEGYKKTLSDRYIENETGGHYCTANAAYKRELLTRFPFDEQNSRMQDRELALRLISIGHTIVFGRQMIVYHAIKKDTIKWRFQSAKNAKVKVMLYKRYHDRANIRCHIYCIRSLAKLVFPPLLVFPLLQKVRSKQDLFIWLIAWPRLAVERYYVWRTAIRERVLVI